MSTREEVEALGFEVPDSIDPVVAYRSWRLGAHAGGGPLCSHNGTVWEAGEPLTAGCLYHATNPHSKIPKPSCTCGIYAAKQERADNIVPRMPHYVFGEVYLWGNIIEAHGGYRAQYAYPKRFFVLKRMKGLVEKLEFGVPIEVVEGSGYYNFPFPEGETRHQYLRRTGQLYPFIPALPCIVLGLVDSFILDLGQAFNQVLVAVMFTIGVAMGLLSFHLRQTIRRFT